MPPVVGKNGDSLDKILLVRLAKGEPVEPPLVTELVKADHLS